MPTVVELTGAKYPNEFKGHKIQPMEGTSLVPALAGKPIDRKQPIYCAHEGNRALRDGKWKLVMKYKGPWELYDMEADRTEQHNLIKEKPEAGRQDDRRVGSLGQTGRRRPLDRPQAQRLGQRNRPPGEKRPEQEEPRKTPSRKQTQRKAEVVRIVRHRHPEGA